jgi:hypothetical protein
VRGLFAFWDPGFPVDRLGSRGDRTRFATPMTKAASKANVFRWATRIRERRLFAAASGHSSKCGDYVRVPRIFPIAMTIVAHMRQLWEAGS